MDLDDKALLDKLRRIEALHAGATTPGERDAAANAMRSIREKLKASEREAPPTEYKFSMADAWTRKLFVSLARRYGLTPYRYSRQRHTTVMLRVSKRFVDETLWPEYQELSETLREWLTAATDRAVKMIHDDTTEAEVRAEPTMLAAADEG
jgi:hypothetical protein